MKATLVAAAITLAASAAMPNPVAHSGNDWVMLTDKPCSEAILGKVDARFHDALHMAKAVIGGQPFEACWLVEPGGQFAHFFYSDGDEGVAPLRAFREEPEV